MKPHALFHLRHDLLAAGGGFFLLSVLSAVTSFFLNAKYSEVLAAQPVVFNHRVHVEDEELECTSCHMYYERETYSGLPKTSACALCHDELQGESAEEEKLVRLIEEGVPLEWASLFRQPPHVFFSHSRHVVVAELECTTCHGDIGHSEAPPEERNPYTMEACIACHEENAGATHCAACHR